MDYAYSKLGCPECKKNNSLTSNCRFKSLKNPYLPVAFLFPLFLANLDKKYRNKIMVYVLWNMYISKL